MNNDYGYPNVVLNAMYNWGEADMDWNNDPSNQHLEYVAEKARKRYVSLCKQYGVEPVQGAVR